MERLSEDGRLASLSPCPTPIRRYRDVPCEIESWLTDPLAQDKNDPDGMETLTRRRRAILKRLSDLDESLASELTRALGMDDSFRARLSNRLARRRALSVCRQLGRGRIRTDLIEEVGAVEPSTEAMAELAPRMMAWDVETRRELDDITQSMLDLAVEKAARELGTFHPGFGLEGATETSEFDPASVDSWMKWNEARNRLLDKRHESLDAIARRTIEIARSMKTVLTEEQYDQLMESVLPKLYGPYLSGRSDLPWLFRQARAELDPIEQASELVRLEELHDGWRSARTAMTDELIEAVVSKRRERRLGDAGKIKRLRSDRAENDRTFKEMLSALMGRPLPERVEKKPPTDRMIGAEGMMDGIALELPAMLDDFEGAYLIEVEGGDAGDLSEAMSETVEGLVGGGAVTGVVVIGGSVTGDQSMPDLAEIELALENVQFELGNAGDFVGQGDLEILGDPDEAMMFGTPGAPQLAPEALDEDAVMGFAESIGLAKSQNMILSLMHADYLELFEIQRALWRTLDSNPFPDPTEAMEEDPLTRLDENERITRALVEIDMAFFEDIENTFDQISSSRIFRDFKQLRRRDFLRRTGLATNAFDFMMRYNREPMVELSALIEEFGLAGDPAASDILEQWHWEIVPLLENYRDLKQDMARLEASFVDFIMTNPDVMEMDPALRKDMMDGHERCVRAEGLISELNHETLERFAGLSDDSTADDMRHWWRRTAWPRIYRDGDARTTQIALEIAPMIDGLSGEQIAEIATVAARYEDDYERLSNSMIESRRRFESQLNDEPGNMEAGMREYRRLQFERRELNARVIRQLEESVGEDHAAQLKGTSSRIPVPIPGS